MVIKLKLPEEFSRVAEVGGPMAELFASGQVPDPAHTIILASEVDGKLVQYWVLFEAVHAEPLYRHPSVRGNAGLALELVTAVDHELQAHGVQAAFGIIADVDHDEVAPLARRLGFEPLPGRLYGRRLSGPPEDDG